MGASWQTEGRFRAQVRELREQLSLMEAIRSAAEEVVRAPTSAGALERLEHGLRRVPAFQHGDLADPREPESSRRGAT